MPQAQVPCLQGGHFPQQSQREASWLELEQAEEKRGVAPYTKRPWGPPSVELRAASPTPRQGDAVRAATGSLWPAIRLSWGEEGCWCCTARPERISHGLQCCAEAGWTALRICRNPSDKQNPSESHARGAMPRVAHPLEKKIK